MARGVLCGGEWRLEVKNSGVWDRFIKLTTRVLTGAVQRDR